VSSLLPLLSLADRSWPCRASGALSIRAFTEESPACTTPKAAAASPSPIRRGEGLFGVAYPQNAASAGFEPFTHWNIICSLVPGKRVSVALSSSTHMHHGRERRGDEPAPRRSHDHHACPYFRQVLECVRPCGAFSVAHSASQRPFRQADGPSAQNGISFSSREVSNHSPQLPCSDPAVLSVSRHEPRGSARSYLPGRRRPPEVPEHARLRLKQFSLERLSRRRGRFRNAGTQHGPRGKS